MVVAIDRGRRGAGFLRTVAQNKIGSQGPREAGEFPFKFIAIFGKLVRKPHTFFN